MDADQAAKVAVQFDGAQGRVRLRVEGVDVLRDHAGDEAQRAETPDGGVGGVGACSLEVRPAEEAAGPVPLSCFVVACELVVVDGSVGFVQGVGAPCAPVVGETGGDRDAGAGEEDGGSAGARGGGEEVGERVDGAGGGVGISRYDDGRREGARVGDS